LIESGGGAVQPSHIHLTASALRADVKPSNAVESESNDDLPLNLDDAEQFLIKRALARTGGNVAEAARRLGINRTRIYRKLGDQSTATSE